MFSTNKNRKIGMLIFLFVVSFIVGMLINIQRLGSLPMKLIQLELEVVADNDRAIALYKKIGFEKMGTFPHNMKYKDGTYADAYWMVKIL